MTEARTSLGVTGILTEFTFGDVGSNGIPRELLALGRPFKLFGGGVGKLFKVPPVVKKAKLIYLSIINDNNNKVIQK